METGVLYTHYKTPVSIFTQIKGQSSTGNLSIKIHIKINFNTFSNQFIMATVSGKPKSPNRRHTEDASLPYIHDQTRRYAFCLSDS